MDPTDPLKQPIFTQASRHDQSRQILCGSAVVNLKIPEQGIVSLAEASASGSKSGVLAWLVYQEIFRTQSRPDRNYVTYDEVAGGMNEHLGTSWVNSGHIEKLARTTKYDERIYSLENAIQAFDYLQGILRGESRGLIDQALLHVTDLTGTGSEEHEWPQVRNMLRATLIYKGNRDLRKYFFTYTVSYLQLAYDNPATDRDFRKNISDFYLNGFGVKPNQPLQTYQYSDDHYFPAHLARSKKVMADLVEGVLEDLSHTKSASLKLPSELDIIIATGYLHGYTTRRIQSIIKEYIYSTYKSPADPDIAILVPTVHVIGRWFSLLTGALMKPNNLVKQNGKRNDVAVQS